MAKERLERRFEGRSDDEIYERAIERLQPFGDRFGLSIEPNDARKTIEARRRGLDGHLSVSDSTVRIDLDFSLLLRPVKGPIVSGVRDVLDGLFDE